jgi:hypothetical protein
MDPNGLNMFKPTKKTIKDHTEDAEPHFFSKWSPDSCSNGNAHATMTDDDPSQADCGFFSHE